MTEKIIRIYRGICIVLWGTKSQKKVIKRLHGADEILGSLCDVLDRPRASRMPREHEWSTYSLTPSRHTHFVFWKHTDSPSTKIWQGSLRILINVRISGNG